MRIGPRSSHVHQLFQIRTIPLVDLYENHNRLFEPFETIDRVKLNVVRASWLFPRQGEIAGTISFFQCALPLEWRQHRNVAAGDTLVLDESLEFFPYFSMQTVFPPVMADHHLLTVGPVTNNAFRI